jgi:transcriptional regulator with XRE-family HTH domain
MLTYETIKKLCKDNGVTVTGLEKELGISRGSLCKVNTNKPSMEKVQKIADYFNVSVEYLMGGEEKEDSPVYYTNEETAAIAQDIFENRELRLLFDAARDAEPEDLTAVHGMLLALKRKERGNID